MIARLWRGWTSRENADAYERLLQERVLPGLKRLDGYRGGYILRQESNEEVEFVVMNLFESLEAVQAFAGPEYTAPVVATSGIWIDQICSTIAAPFHK
jgi:heme-degrading monooxygenase HmoA